MMQSNVTYRWAGSINQLEPPVSMIGHLCPVSHSHPSDSRYLTVTSRSLRPVVNINALLLFLLLLLYK